jgi:hypothetical protein
LKNNPDLLAQLTKNDPSIREFLHQALSDNTEDIDCFIHQNIEPRLQTTYLGNADTLSAQVILSRLVPSISIPSIDLTA